MGHAYSVMRSAKSARRCRDSGPKELTRVHQTLRVHGTLDALHHFIFHGWPESMGQLAAQLPQAMLCAHRTAVLRHGRVHDVVDGAFARKRRSGGHASTAANIEMQVAVTQMAKDKRLQLGAQPRERQPALAHEII